MRQLDATHQESIEGNLGQWCYEVDSEFQQANNDAAEDAASYINPKNKVVIELGCGDGASLIKFHELGFATIGVDINADKLDRALGPKVKADMVDWLWGVKDNSLANIFMHHSIEHIINVDELIGLVTLKLAKGGIFYCVTPADDTPNTVHYTAFDSAEELLPPGLKPLVLTKQERFGHPEYKCVAIK
jgi:SAM-dependent methyltransferase